MEYYLALYQNSVDEWEEMERDRAKDEQEEYWAGLLNYYGGAI